MSSRLLHLNLLRARRGDVTRILRAAAPVAVLLLGPCLLAGCDTPANQDDRKVQADVMKAQAALADGNDAGVAAARRALETAAQDTGPSPLTRAYAKSSLAEVEQDSASQKMREIDRDDSRLRRLAWEISQLAQQIDASRAMAGSYAKYDPKPARDSITAAIATAQGGPDVPNLSAVKQTISQLQGQIAKQTDELKSLQDQRTQVLDEADQADKSSEISKGQQSVDDFKRAADLRKQAGDLAVQIDKNKAQTIPLQKDLDVAQAQQTILQELVEKLQEESQQLGTGWDAVQKAVASQADLQKQIAGGEASSGGDTAAPAAPAPAAPADAVAMQGVYPSERISPTAGKPLSDKAEALGKLVDEIKRERSDALSDLNNAIQHYRDAAKAGQEYFAAIDPKIKDPANAQRPEINGWKTLQAIANPAVFRLKEALAQRQLAELNLSQIINDDTRSQLQDQVSKVLGSVDIAVPAALSESGLEDDKKNAGEAALGAFKVADDEISSLTHSAAPDPLPKIARVQHVLTLYSQVQLARAMGDTATAQDKLTQTTTERDEALHDGLILPPLPSEITPPPAPVAPPAAAPPT